jgi:putative oxidoreductase
MKTLNKLQPLALLALRLALGAIMIAHGWPKVFHGEVAKTVATAGNWGWPAWLGYVAAWTELAGGVLLIVGLLTRLAALLIAGEMLVAIWKVHLHNGLGARPGSMDLALASGVIAFALIWLGGGVISLDKALFGDDHRL